MGEPPATSSICGYRPTVGPQPSKLMMSVRSRLAAPVPQIGRIPPAGHTPAPVASWLERVTIRRRCLHAPMGVLVRLGVTHLIDSQRPLLWYQHPMSWIADAMLEGTKIIGGGVIASAITLFANGRRQDRELKRTATSLATRLVPIFELYARSCAEIRDKHQHDRYQDGPDGGPYDFSWIGSVPELPPLPEDDEGWRALTPDLGARAQGFHLLIHAAKQMINAEGVHGEAYEVAMTLEQQAATIGLEAYRLASDMIDRYGLPRPELPWNYVRHFENEQVRIEASREAQRETNSKMIAEMGT